MTSTSTASRMSSRAQSQAVPPTRATSPESSASRASSLVVVSRTWPVGASSGASETLCSAGRSALSSTFRMTACDRAVTPTRFPASSSARISCTAAYVLPVPGGPCTASTSPSRARPIRTTAAAGSSPGRTASTSAARHDARQQPRGHAALPRQHGLGGVGDGLAQHPVDDRAGRLEASRLRGLRAGLHRQVDPPLDAVVAADPADVRVGVDVGDVLAHRQLAVLRRERVAPDLRRHAAVSLSTSSTWTGSPRAPIAVASSTSSAVSRVS